MITKPVVGTIPPWADLGDKTQPADGDIAIGFPKTNDKPTRQVMNWAFNYTTNGVLYLTSRGLPDWGSATNYITGDVVRDTGKFYCAKTANIGNQPSISPTQWVLLYVFRTDLDALYLTPAQGDARYLSASSAAATYETIASAATAHSNLQSQIDGIPAAADTKYLSIANAAATYETIVDADAAHKVLQDQLDSISLSPDGGFIEGAGIDITGAVISNTAPHVKANWYGVVGSESEILNRPPITVSGLDMSIAVMNIQLTEAAAVVCAPNTSINLAYGAHYDGTSWVADQASACHVAVGAMGTNFKFFSTASLTIGDAFAPMTIASLVTIGGANCLQFADPTTGGLINEVGGNQYGAFLRMGAITASAGLVATKGSYSQVGGSGGNVSIFGNTGLTIGAVFTPQQLAGIAPVVNGGYTSLLLYSRAVPQNQILSGDDANGLFLAGGGHFDGSWTAHSTSCAHIAINTNGYGTSGGFTFLGNMSLTVGATFAPTILAKLKPDWTTPTGTDFYIYSANGSRYLKLSVTNAYNASVWTSTGLFEVNGSIIVNNGILCQPGRASASKAASFSIDYVSPSASLWIDYTNMGIFAFTSDYRIKKNVKPLDKALWQLLQLRPVSFEYADTDSSLFKSDGVARLGFIAHEVQEVFPSAVFGEKDALTKDKTIQPQSLNWPDMMAVVVKSIQELAFRMAIIETVLSNLTPKEA